MRCPFCREDRDKVIDSRSASDGAVIRRRRECLACERRYTTYERVEETPLRVVKKDGTRVPFDRQKVLTGLMKACEKRPIPTGTLEQVVDDIEREVNDSSVGEVPSRDIGELVMKKLRQLDQVAYVRFASVYREFQDIEEFFKELRPLLDERKSE